MTAFSRRIACASPAPAKSRLAKNLLRLTACAALCCSLFALPQQALAINDDAVLRRMDAVLEENARLREEFWKARKAGGKEGARQAEEALSASEERVEKTRTEALAHVAGVSPAQVDSLRKDGRSWGQAAGELGVHPGFLGVGKTPLYESLPKRKATAEAQQPKGKHAKKALEKAPAKQSAKAGAKAGTKAEKPAAKKAGEKKSPAKHAAKTPAKAKPAEAKKQKKAKE